MWQRPFFLQLFILATAIGLAAGAVFQHELIRRESKRSRMIREGTWEEYYAKKEARKNQIHELVRTGVHVSMPQSVNDYDDLEYIAQISLGTPAMEFSVFPDTGSSNLWVPGTACQANGCAQKNHYDPSRSTTYVPNGTAFAIGYGSGSAVGTLVQDMLRFVGDGGRSLNVPDTVFAQASNVSTELLGTMADGILGLAFVSISVDRVTPPVQHAIDLGILDAPIFTVWLEHKRAQFGVRGGVFTYGAVDTTNCGPVIAYQPLSSASYWQYTVSAVSIGTYSYNKNQDVFSDTGTSLLGGPEAQVSAILQQVNASPVRNKLGRHNIACNANIPDLVFTIGTNAYAVTAKDTIIENGQGQPCDYALFSISGSGFGNFARMPIDGLVDRVRPYRDRPVWSHLYVGPFAVAYALWAWVWLSQLGFDDYYELGCVGCALIALSQALAVLFCHWFVQLKCFCTLTPAKSASDAHFVCVQPTPNNGWAEIVPLRRSRHLDHSKLWFEFQKSHYVYQDETGNWSCATLDVSRPFDEFLEARGYETDAALEEARFLFGNNKMEMFVPKFLDLFIERATAPFFVFQVFCVGLWCLEDMWYYSAFTLAMLMTFEATLVNQQLRNMQEIRNMGNRPYPIYVFRNKKWARINSDELVPGDVVSITRSTDEQQVVPADLLLLRGPCIVDESMLTGESVPQMKEPIEAVPDRTHTFDFDGDARLHVIAGGTRVVQHSAPRNSPLLDDSPGNAAKQEAGMKAPDNGCICYVLRAGFGTNQGRLLRTILFGVKRVTANNWETFCFILFLLIFAVAAAVYLWIKGTQDESRSRYKLALECSLILTSVIPPELPIELSLAVNNSLLALQKLGVFCTEPFRIPFAGKLDVCCFDKTGTLTMDSLEIEGIATGLTNDNVELAATPDKAPQNALQVLVACHSLVVLDSNELVGDPLEKACLDWMGWTVTKNDAVIPKKQTGGTGLSSLKIHQRHHFSSALKRMAVVASELSASSSQSQQNFLAAVKGAPEVVRSMLTLVPKDYDETYLRLTRRGTRVLALAHKSLGQLTSQEVRDLKRADLEKNLTFAGFVVISCPLKSDTKQMIAEIRDSSHVAVMVTGDNALTACHVAKELKFTAPGRQILVLEQKETNEWVWRSTDGGDLEKPWKLERRELPKFMLQYDICITGSAFDFLPTADPDLWRRLLPHVRVFARMAPKQKEKVVNELKELGLVTLMCGDGTNDVGALKHANVGVALLSHPIDTSKAEEQRKQREQKQRDIQAAALEARRAALLAAQQPLTGSRRQAQQQQQQQPAQPPPNTLAGLAATNSPAARKLEQLMKEMEEEDRASVVRLGDASIAAPFTSKHSSVQSICHVIKQGRCTLVTTLQMFKILALNALVLAYSQSALYLEGIKYSDSQATIQGVLLAACFLFISRSKPLSTLAPQRPVATIFNAYTLLTIALQFVIHFGSLLAVVNAANEAEPRAEKADITKEFAPSVLNTSVYVISMALQVSTFAVNYRGRPFMESLLENKPMLYAVLGAGAAVWALAVGVSDELSAKFELVQLPEECRQVLVYAVAIDLLGCLVVDRVLNYVLGDARA